MEVGSHFPSISPFGCDSIPSVAYRQMHSFLGSICLTASECFPIFVYSFGLAETWQGCLFVTAHVLPENSPSQAG